MKSIFNIIKKKINTDHFFAQKITAYQIVEISNQVIQKLLAETSSSAQALYIKNKILTISCTHSVVAQELKLKQSIIKQEINSKCNKEVVNHIRLVQV